MGNYESTETMGKGKTIKYNANKGLCINLHNDLQESGAEINLWQCNKHQSQRWEVEVINDHGECLIHYAANPDFVINLHCAAEENGAVINLWEKNGSVSQKWILDGNQICYAANPNFVINLHNATQEDGAVINLWEKNGHESQDWTGKQLKCADSSASSSASWSHGDIS